MGVYRRLGVNEPADALVMLMNNGYEDAPKADGNYQLLLNSGDQKYAVSAAGGSAKLDVRSAEGTDQVFTLNYFAGGFYTISTQVDGKTLRLSADESTVSLSSPSISDGQKWS